MKIRFANHFLLLFLFLTAGLLLTGCCKDAEDPENQKIHRTVLVYMAAENSLGADGYMDSDLKEIQEGMPSVAGNNRLLVFVDNEKETTLYRYMRNKTRRIVKQWDKDECSTDPAFFQSVLDLVARRYPSEEYGLVCWSHGTGWLPSTNKNYAGTLSFGADTGPGGNEETNKDRSRRLAPQMDVDDMAAAIEKSAFRPLFIMFDACYMQDLETIYSLRNATKTLIGSPIATNAEGADYTHELQRGFFSSNVADIAKTYCEDQQDPALRDTYQDYGVVVSAVRPELIVPLAELLRKALPHSALAGKAALSMKGVQSYNYYLNDPSAGVIEISRFKPKAEAPDYLFPVFFDAQDALRVILSPQDYQAAKTLIERMTLYKGASNKFWVGPNGWDYKTLDLNRYCGISMFVPQTIYTKDYRSGVVKKDLNALFRSTEWYKATDFSSTGW